jgi:hypothetical protein
VRSYVLVLLMLAACSHDHGAPRVQPTREFTPTGASPLRGGGTARSPRIANYKLEARLDTARHQVIGTELLSWTNTGESAVDTLPFHLYMNAFKNDATLFMRESHGEMRGARATDTGWGWIQIDSVAVNSTELVTQLRYPGAPGDPADPKLRDQTVAELPLPAPVAPGARIEVQFKFTVQLPEVFARTGYKGEFHMIGQWFPKIGVRVGPPGAERWECLPFHAFSEFFADFGTYDVTLTVPSTHMVAATGVLVGAQEVAGGTRTLHYLAEDVHDFAWMADPYMKVMKRDDVRVDDGPPISVRVYYRPEQADFAARHLDAAVGAIQHFSADFVPYPWPVMSVIDPPVDAAAGAGGMEYPTLVTTGEDSVFNRPGIRVPEYVTIHEIGHNWFQGLLASNEAEEAWLDEGVNDWADGHVMSELYGPRRGLDWEGWQADLDVIQRALLSEDPATIPQPIATASYAFVDASAYFSQTYITTERALSTLEQLVGSAKFMAAMKAYARAWAWKHPTGRDLYAALDKELGDSYGWFYGPAFHEVGGMRLAIRSASCRPWHPTRGVIGDGSARKLFSEAEAADSGTWECEVVIASTGAVHTPIDIELRFADGSTERRTWDDRDGATWQRFVIERSARMLEVRLDPDGKLALDSPVAHAYRLDGNGAASLRAAARISSWAQTMMELVGP